MNEQKNALAVDSKRQRYEAPKANCVRVKIGERFGCCLFANPRYCAYAGN